MRRTSWALSCLIAIAVPVPSVFAGLPSSCKVLICPWDFTCPTVSNDDLSVQVTVMPMAVFILNDGPVADLFLLTLTDDSNGTAFPPLGAALLPPGGMYVHPFFYLCDPGSPVNVHAEVTGLLGANCDANSLSAESATFAWSVTSGGLVQALDGDEFGFRWTITNDSDVAQPIWTEADFELSSMSAGYSLAINAITINPPRDCLDPCVIEPGASFTIDAQVTATSLRSPAIKDFGDVLLAYDIDHNGAFDVNSEIVAAAGVQISPQCPPPSPDLNGDGTVDGADLALVLGAWGTSGAP